jgi:hypothetical protein
MENSLINLRQLTANGEDCLMIAIKRKNMRLVKYLLFSTVHNKFKQQLDFNNGRGDAQEDEAPLEGEFVIDKMLKFKHTNSLRQCDMKGRAYIFNILYANCKNTLNYFALAVLLGHFEIATLLGVELYNRTQPFNNVLYKSKINDGLYQHHINPQIKISKHENQTSLFNYCLAHKL